MPMESALLRLSLAGAMARQGDIEDADLQLANARRSFGPGPDVASQHWQRVRGLVVEFQE
jgi:hypothetical protein